MRIITAWSPARVAARFLVSFRNSLTPLVSYDTLRRQLYCRRQQKKSCLRLDLPSVPLRTLLSDLLRSAANRWLNTRCIISSPPRIPDPAEFISEQIFRNQRIIFWCLAQGEALAIVRGGFHHSMSSRERTLGVVQSRNISEHLLQVVSPATNTWNHTGHEPLLWGARNEGDTPHSLQLFIYLFISFSRGEEQI